MIDDSRRDRDLFKLQLERWGYRLEAYPDAFDALIAFDKGKPGSSSYPFSGVLIDMALVGTDGLTVAREVRRIEGIGSARVPIVFISGHPELRVVDGMEVEPFGVLDKLKLEHSAAELATILQGK